VEATRTRGPRAGEAAPMRTPLLVLVGGPIASGKSTLAQELRRRLRESGTSAAALDVDLAYELLEERGHSPGEPELWLRAYRLAGRIAACLFAEGVEVVVVEAGFLAAADAETVIAAAGRTAVRRISLRTSLETALARVQLDDDRGISRDPQFLARHYEALAPALVHRPSDELVLDTETMSPEEAARRVAARL
jgi:adenylylsulfate kinase-like enzyme